jgi:hypothetical protein
MKYLLPAFVALLLTLTTAQAQQSPQPPSSIPHPNPAPPLDLASRVPPPKPDDVKSLDAILRAIYDVISGPACERDWHYKKRRLLGPSPPHHRRLHPARRKILRHPRLLRIRHRQSRPKIRKHRPSLQQLRIPQRSERKALRPRHQQHSTLLRRPAVVGPQHPVGRRILRQSITFRNGHQALRPGVRVTRRFRSLSERRILL